MREREKKERKREREKEMLILLYKNIHYSGRNMHHKDDMRVIMQTSKMDLLEENYGGDSSIEKRVLVTIILTLVKPETCVYFSLVKRA